MQRNYSSCFSPEVAEELGETEQPALSVPPAPAYVSQPTLTERIQWIMLDRQIRLLAQRTQRA
jgi:hypothetical protein